MTLDIEKFKYYLRWYPFLYGADCIQWWFDPRTYTVIHNDEVKRQQEYDLTCTEAMIPIPKVNIPMLEESFLKSTGQDEIIEQLHKAYDSDFDIEFKKYVDHACQLAEWYSFESKYLRASAKKWCHNNGIEYN